MPRLRKKSHRRRQYSPDEVFWPLVIGTSLGGDPVFTDAELPELWQRYGGELMTEWEQDPSHAGHRPWAWWRFVAGEDQPAARDEPARLKAIGELTSTEEFRLDQRRRKQRPRSLGEVKDFGVVFAE